MTKQLTFAVIFLLSIWTVPARVSIDVVKDEQSPRDGDPSFLDWRHEKNYSKVVKTIESNLGYNDSDNYLDHESQRRGFKSYFAAEPKRIISRLYKSTTRYICTYVFSFIKTLLCPKDEVLTEKKDVHSSPSRLQENEIKSVKNENPVFAIETPVKRCDVGNFIPSMKVCLFRVFKKLPFAEAQNACRDFSEGGKLWTTNILPQEAHGILSSNNIITNSYSVWIDGVYLENTMIGSGHFDSLYRKWLSLGHIRGRRHHKDKILLEWNEIETEDTAFYSYQDGRQQYTFICESPPIKFDGALGGNYIFFEGNSSEAEEEETIKMS